MEKFKKFLLVNTSKKQTVAKNAFWLFVSEATGRLLKMLLVIYAARVLGVNGWGIFSYAISVSSLLTFFADIGLGDLIVREASQKKEGYQAFISTALLLKITVLLASTILVIVVSPHISHLPEARALFPVVAFILFFDSMRELGLSINRASERMERDMTVKTVTNALILGLGILFLKVKLAPESIALAYVIGSAIGFCTIAWIIRKDIRKLLGRVDRKIFKQIVQITWPLAFITLIGILLGNIDIYMLGIWRGAGEIGLYASVQRIQQFLIIIPGNISSAVFPLMSRLAHTDKEQLGIILEKSLSFVMALVMPIALGGAVLSGEIVPLVLGRGYLGAIPILAIWLLMLLLSFPLILLSGVIFSFNKQRELAGAYLFGILGNVIFNILLIPKWGAVGSSIATVVSTAIITFIIWRKLRKLTYFSVLPKLKKSFLASLLMLLPVFLLQYLKVNVVFNILVAAAAYFSLLFFFREPIFREIKEIVSSR